MITSLYRPFLASPYLRWATLLFTLLLLAARHHASVTTAGSAW